MFPGTLYAGRTYRLTPRHAVERGSASRSTSGATGLLAPVYRVARALLAWHERAGLRRAMARLDDHILRDIGLTRQDVELELIKPFWRP